MAYIWLILSGACSVVASVALKIGGSATKDGGVALLSMNSLVPYGIAIGSYGLGFALYAAALRELDLSLAYPLMVAIAIIGVMTYGLLFGNESVTICRGIGAALIATGVFFVTR